MADIAIPLKAALREHYLLERELGRGGMATVYLAHDVKHGRLVALKVLHPELAAVIGAERFLAEIKLTANLQHPHILPLFDSGEADSFLYYVMPYVEGESLRDRLRREKQLPIEEAVRLVGEVASALDYAHRHDVVHRDIKPENILLHEGRALVADFGIALAASKASGTRMTETGMSLGTPHYMSPEQAMGEREITARSDVYALGAVLYEMLTGDPPFTGSTAQAIVARVLTETPRPLVPQRHTIPPHVEAAALTALEKLPADRFASAATFTEALLNPVFDLRASRRRVPSTGVGLQRWQSWTFAAAATMGALAGFALGGGWWPPPKQVDRYNIPLPPAVQVLQPADIGMRIAISPDGRSWVYVGPDEQLWLREHDQLRATLVAGTEGATNPFFSPDGRHVGFFTFDPSAPPALKLVSLGGGPPVTLLDSGVSRGGGAWGSDGYVYFAAERGLRRIKATGGVPEPVVTFDSARGEVGHAWPDVLPNHKGLLFRLERAGHGPPQYDVVVANLETREQRVLARGVLARYAASGHLVYVTADGKLLAAPFDQNRLALTGPPTPLLGGLAIRGYGVVDLALSATGTLVYTSPATASADVVWVTRDGTARSVDLGLKGDFDIRSLALSPDGKQLALDLVQGTGSDEDIWLKQLDGGPLSRLTHGGHQNERPEWTADGLAVLFLSNPTGRLALYAKRADGSDSAHLLALSAHDLGEGLQSRDGRWLLARTFINVPGAGDIIAFRPGVDSGPSPLVATKFTEASPAVSPDGRWLAYSSNESGRHEVYVSPFPKVGDARWQISASGGTEPRWAHSEHELFYRSGSGDMVAAEVRTSGSFSVSSRRPLFSAAPYAALGVHQTYDVGPDDKRFIMIRTNGSRNGDQRDELIVVKNWFEELKTRMKR